MRFDQSARMYARSCRSLAGGISSNVRAASHPFPLFYRGGQGSRLFDVDGNEYIDYCLGQGPLILGHSHPRVVRAVKQQVEIGQLYAGQHELEILVSEKLQRLIPCAELVRFSNSGSEAVHIALRVARAFTGKKKIIKFEGHYHGWFDNILIGFHPDSENVTELESKGQTDSVFNEVIVLPWNNLEAVADTLRRQAETIAAVIMEPIMCNTGCILPEAGYLEGIRKLCSDNNILLIFDEIITGFRIGLGGAQKFYGVVPDLATFGKAMASGFPVSCLAGKREIMELIADLSVVHAGTYNSNPVCLAAALATIEELEKGDGYHHRRLFNLGQQLMREIKELSKRKGINLLVQGPGPMFHLAFTEREQIRNYRDYLDVETARYVALANRLQDLGVRVIHRGIWYLSTAHTQQDVALTLEKLVEALQ
jgi:glutamate-1-semialdehyde 2,1-aminomutase